MSKVVVGYCRDVVDVVGKLNTVPFMIPGSNLPGLRIID